jgi:hypothetical protein
MVVFVSAAYLLSFSHYRTVSLISAFSMSSEKKTLFEIILQHWHTYKQYAPVWNKSSISYKEDNITWLIAVSIC